MKQPVEPAANVPYHSQSTRVHVAGLAQREINARPRPSPSPIPRADKQQLIVRKACPLLRRSSEKKVYFHKRTICSKFHLPPLPPPPKKAYHVLAMSLPFGCRLQTKHKAMRHVLCAY